MQIKITTTRRISQAFFFFLFIWFCIVNTLGDSFTELRGWPVNLFLQLDPLTAIATALSTHSLYKELLPAILVIIVTIVLGRFFCSWICPFGTLHHFVGFLAHRKKSTKEKIKLNIYRNAQKIKYYILIIFLIMAALPLSTRSLQTGLLDPIPLFTRSVNTVLLPILDGSLNYEGAWIIFIVFIALTLLNIILPRFFCRILCPLGALMGILGRFAIFRIGQNTNKCNDCRLCEKACEGGCEPATKLYHHECVLCFNCYDDCIHNTISYQTDKSTSGEIPGTGISRKAFITTVGSGIFLVPAVRLSGFTGPNWHQGLIRPPGAASEKQFLSRCLKCGQCMRICPTNIIQPGRLAYGIENMWTPELNFRTGTSGCQYNCVACGQSCPTAAIRPITLEEKHGIGKFKKTGMIKIGTAFVDRPRCLPWAMNIPCIVCQENCPVSPKAIYTDEYFEPIRGGTHDILAVSGNFVKLKKANLQPGAYSSGDYYIRTKSTRGAGDLDKKYKIISNDKDSIKTDRTITEPITPGADFAPGAGSKIDVLVRLQRPYMDIEKCNGCGICEHECPVHGKKAIRVSAEGETRNPEKRLLLKRG